MRRRHLLSATLGGLGLVAGCLGRFAGVGQDSEPLSCGNEWHRLNAFSESYASPWREWRLTTNRESLQYGDEMRVTLTNESDQEAYTGIPAKYDIQERTEEGWRSVLWIDQKVALTDEALVHEPEEGLTWTFTVREETIEGVEEEYHICDAIEPGRYRFAYYGIGDEHAAITTPFEVVE
ncbi:hypothetical protein U3A55_05575 [Salarchaeum sp. III]|uniref:hypothetical protein n=1 Tax=Salarchaeum sp. III TaxID=3107927 RepID=UPI002ED907D9